MHRSTPDLLYATSTPMAEEEDLSFNESSLNWTEDRVTDLPPSSVLQHLGKARPKRAKKHAPSRGAVAVLPQTTTTSGSTLANNNDSSVDDGVDSFYPVSFNSSGFSSPSSANR